ncbi:MAG: DHA2 family efflux MFS transporter permease subunit [Hyphomicrobiaceae bacterium]
MTYDDDLPVLQLPVSRRVFALLTVVAASGSFNAATFSVAAVLPQLQGALSATQDEVSWAVTFYILATAVCLPMSGWLVARFGRCNVQFYCLAGFTFSTVMCGMAQTLDQLVLWRLIQGSFGAPLMPLGQSVLMDVFPRRQHGLVIAIFGTTNTIGPIVGPTFAGYLAETLGWRWGFFMIVPVALAATVAARFALPDEVRQRNLSLDWIGFLSLSVAIASTQFVLSRGQKLDWFESNEIVVEVCLAAIAFYIFLVHSATARQPYLSPRLLLDKNYVIGICLIVIFGMLNFTPMVLLPPLMQNELGYPDGLIGFVVSWRGAGVMSGSFASIFAQRFDPRFGMVAGFSLQIISGFWLMHLSLEAPLSSLCANAWLQGTAVGLIWTPIVTTAFRTLEPTLRAEGIAVMHLMRSIGSSFFISVSVTQVIRVTSSNYSRLTEKLNPYNKVLELPDAMGRWSTETTAGFARLAKEIHRQAAMLGYMNAFVMYTVASMIAIPLVLMLGGRKTNKG